MRIKLGSSRQRGIGLVELMVGITIGLIVTAGASMVAVNQINEHRRLMLETQLQQDLRTAADLIQHDLRRAGFRGTAEHSVWAPPSVASSLGDKAADVATANPYASITSGDLHTSLTYSYARQQSDNSYDASDTVKSNENFGIKWDSTAKVLSLKLGNKADGTSNWQPITDPNVVEVTEFSAIVNTQDIDLGDFCDNPCGGAFPACPVQKVREVNFKIVAKATHDSNVVRTLTGVERIRADALTGVCPP